MTRTISKSAARRENAMLPFAVLAYRDFSRSADKALSRDISDALCAKLIDDFVMATTIGADFKSGKRINLDRVENALRHRGLLDKLERMFCTSLIVLSEQRIEKVERARRHNSPLPAPKTTLPGELRPWFERHAKAVLRTRLAKKAQ